MRRAATRLLGQTDRKLVFGAAHGAARVFLLTIFLGEDSGGSLRDLSASGCGLDLEH
jgi:hypothetical protein